ncbi:MAG: 30S ribosomal protein S11 [Planctomycetes bacterium]|nr:30S ribosomal protein S11 [Planctomycetota bacterium]
MGKYQKKKVKRTVSRGKAFINASFNNTIITITDSTGATVCWDSAGGAGFKGSRKSYPFAAQMAAASCAEKAVKLGVREVDVCVKGPGGGRESAVRALKEAGINIRSITDNTPIPHNGCRPCGHRRV